MITLHTLSMEDYKKLVAKMLFNVEKDENNPYVDSILHVTIGRGFDIEGSKSSRDKVFEIMKLDPKRLDIKNSNYQQQFAKEKSYIDKILAAIETYNTNADIQRELNKIMADRAGDPALQTYSYITNRTTFSLTNDEIEQTYQNIIKDFEDTISRLFGDTTALPPSKERAVLISMAYQGSIKSVRSELQQAMVTDNNQAEAWYLIRYKAIGSHYGAQDGGGHAKRHYYESQVFSLYDNPANVTLA